MFRKCTETGLLFCRGKAARANGATPPSLISRSQERIDPGRSRDRVEARMKAFAGRRRGDLGCGPMKQLCCVSFLLLSSSSIVFAQSATDPLAPTRDTKSAVEIDREWQQSVAKYDGERNRLLAGG